MNIRSSMYRMVSLLITVPFLLFSLIITYIYADKLGTVITESLQAVANAQMAEMTNFCKEQMNNLNILGDMEVSHAALRGELDPHTLDYLDNILESRVQITSYLKNAALVDTDYRVVTCSEKNYEIFANDGLSSLIEDMHNESFHISNVVHDPENTEDQSVVAISLIEENGHILGYAIAEINLDFYDDIRKQAELWDESTFYLLDGNQQIISAGTTMEDRKSFVTSEKDREDYNRKYSSIDFKANPKGSFTYKVAGRSYITYYSEVEYTNWQFMLTVNIDNYLAGRTIYGILACILVLLCLAVALWIGSFTSRRIIRPIKHISDTLFNIQQEQDYSLRIKAERNDELGNLSGKINGLLSFIETENLYKAKQQRLLQQKAEQDALTKVLNKERINEYLREAIDRHRANKSEMAVMFIDVDDFKAFNTDYGHDVGDQVLLFLTSLLVRETTGTVGRIGGDEFMVILESPEHLRILDTCLERIKQMSHTQFIIRGTRQHLPVSCCIGAVMVQFTDSGPSATGESLLKLADEAMYQVKNNGKHGYTILNCIVS